MRPVWFMSVSTRDMDTVFSVFFSSSFYLPTSILSLPSPSIIVAAITTGVATVSLLYPPLLLSFCIFSLPPPLLSHLSLNTIVVTIVVPPPSRSPPSPSSSPSTFTSLSFSLAHTDASVASPCI
ncbi:uncharacterized protein DS421_5g171150 [Arachis hypogaea]|nr:uncharacterized protein DS421_5g171150 [Arachis hypogaea]